MELVTESGFVNGMIQVDVVLVHGYDFDLQWNWFQKDHLEDDHFFADMLKITVGGGIVNTLSVVVLHLRVSDWVVSVVDILSISYFLVFLDMQNLKV